MHIWDYRRARSPFLAILVLVLGALLLDAAVSATSGWDRFGGIEEPQTFNRDELASAKAAALASAIRKGERVGLVVGMSTADWGIDLRMLEAADGLKWAKVTGEFASFGNMLEIVERIEREGATPAKTLLCMNYGMLVGNQRPSSTWQSQLARVLGRGGRLRPAARASLGWTLTWLGHNRTHAANAFETRLGALRESILTEFSQSHAAIYPSVSDPFADSPNEHGRSRQSVWEGRLDGIRARWASAIAQAGATGTRSNAQTRALTRIVALLGKRPGFSIVVMPEHSALRAAIPESFARGMMTDAIAAAGLDRPPAIVDIRAALPDEDFADDTHASHAGRPHFTAALARAVAEHGGAEEAMAPARSAP